MPDEPPFPTPPPTGVLIRVENGDVVAADATGLTLRLPDAVLADLLLRLGGGAAPDPADILGDIDAWNLRTDGAWWHFTARLAPGGLPRGYRRAIAGGDIIADAPGPLYALLRLGGARAAGFNDGPAAFAQHVLAPGDDIGAVGLEGTGAVTAAAALQQIPHRSRDALIADTLLGWRHDALRGLPLFMVRAETDGSADIAALGQGLAYANFRAALDSLVAAAAALGKRPRVLAISLDYGLEDQTSTATGFAAGMRALMRQITRDLGARGLTRPVFLIPSEAGTQWLTDHPSIRALAELARGEDGLSVTLPAPGYMFAQTRHGRPTAGARARMAAMDAHAIVGLSQHKPWFCPLLLLAESDGATIRVTARAMGDLVIEDTFGAGPACGFHLTGTAVPCRVTGASLAPDDPQALLLTCDAPPEAAAGQPAPLLHYAHGAPPSAGPEAHPANRGALRDTWAAPCAGGPLHRWALPAVLPVQKGGPPAPQAAADPQAPQAGAAPSRKEARKRARKQERQDLGL